MLLLCIPFCLRTACRLNVTRNSLTGGRIPPWLKTAGLSAVSRLQAIRILPRCSTPSRRWPIPTNGSVSRRCAAPGCKSVKAVTARCVAVRILSKWTGIWHSIWWRKKTAACAIAMAPRACLPAPMVGHPPGVCIMRVRWCGAFISAVAAVLIS
ncbi:hypothetical protein D3C78_1113860 [compost metagenome]